MFESYDAYLDCLPVAAIKEGVTNAVRACKALATGRASSYSLVGATHCQGL
jgi:hypothetical protein